MEKNFGHLEKDLRNLPDDVPKPGQFGHQPEATELYRAAAANHVKAGGLLADHYVLLCIASWQVREPT